MPCMAMIVMVFIMIANCIVQCDMDGLYVQDNKMATEAILGQSFVFAPLSPTLAPWSRNIGD